MADFPFTAHYVTLTGLPRGATAEVADRRGNLLVPAVTARRGRARIDVSSIAVGAPFVLVVRDGDGDVISSHEMPEEPS